MITPMVVDASLISWRWRCPPVVEPSPASWLMFERERCVAPPPCLGPEGVIAWPPSVASRVRFALVGCTVQLGQCLYPRLRRVVEALWHGAGQARIGWA